MNHAMTQFSLFGRAVSGTGLLAALLSTSSAQEPLDHQQNAAQSQGSSPALAGYRSGRAVYVDNCIGCHRYDGRGVPDVFPSLKGSALVGLKDPTVVINWILNGVPPVAIEQDPADAAGSVSYDIAMPAFYWKLSDAEIAAVASYIRNAWGNTAPAVEAPAVAEIRQAVAAR